MMATGEKVICIGLSGVQCCRYPAKMSPEDFAAMHAASRRDTRRYLDDWQPRRTVKKAIA
jgi:hypothetical protein